MMDKKIDYQRYTDTYWNENQNEHEAIVEEHLLKISEGAKSWRKWMQTLTNSTLEKKYGIAHIYLVNIPINFSFKNLIFSLPTSFINTSFGTEASFLNVQFIASVDFQRAKFTNANFPKASFRKTSNFNNVIFNGDSNFSSSNFHDKTNFQGSTFHGDCEFIDVTFHSDANFEKVQFKGLTEFPNSSFLSDCYFNRSHFIDDATFSNCSFQSDAYFANIVFYSNASFLESKFEAYADFGDVHFNKDIDFTYAEFEKASRFDNSVFNSEANFYSCKFEKAATFKNTKLTSTPEFNFSKFIQPPYLAHMEIPFQSNGSESDIIHRYMKLKHMAIISNDHDQELRYFGYEMRAKGQLKKTPLSHKTILFLYFKCSNFGQSIIRPITTAILFVIFMISLNFTFIKPNTNFCTKNNISEFQAIVLYSVSSAIPIINITKTEKSAVRKCLFGDRIVLPIQHQIWRLLHLIPTSIFLFLFGLGVRNRFKIK